MKAVRVYGGSAVLERTSASVGILWQCEAATLSGRLFDVEMLSVSTSDECDVGGGEGSEDDIEKLRDGGRLILLGDITRKR